MKKLMLDPAVHAGTVDAVDFAVTGLARTRCGTRTCVTTCDTRCLGDGVRSCRPP